MGLDIYLKHCPNPDYAFAQEAAYEAASEKAWAEVGEYDKLSDAQKEALRLNDEALKKTFGIDDGYHESNKSYCEDSAIDPEHMFKVGYFRSSYNEGGINRVLKDRGLLDLYGMFDVDDGEEPVRPDWAATLARVTATLVAYEAMLKGPAGKFLVTSVRPMFEFGVSSAQEALDMYVKAHGDPATARPFGGGGYSNRDGVFCPEGMKVVAFITKKFTPSSKDDLIGRLINTPEIFAVYEREESETDDWYLTALRIVKETVEFVLAQPNPNTYYLRWSG